MEPNIHNLALHCATVKELWCFLREFYGRSNNINLAYEVIQELFWKKQSNRPMDDHYGEFNRLAEKFQQIFLIASDMTQM